MIQIGAPPDSGFDDPLGILADCHRRIERFLDVLCRIATNSQCRELTSQEAEAVVAALRYFRESGVRHNADEEESLFPRLRGLDATIVAEVDALEAEHQRASMLHATIERSFHIWLVTGSVTAADCGVLAADANKLRKLYQAHIETEEQLIFPRAAVLLDPSAIAEMGAELKARRAT